MKKLCKIIFVILFIFTNAVYAEETRPAPVNNCDPLEPMNRVFFQFNDAMDKIFLKPAAQLYIKIVPKPLVKGISNFFNNLDTVPTVANDLLQTNFYQAANDAWRLGINTTLGIGGFFDVAAQIGLEPNTEDLGLTFAHWGYKNSNYLVIPFFGPSTFRDAIAMPINYELFTVYPYIPSARDRYALYAVGVVSKRADLLGFQGLMEEISLDDYTFVRNAYLQHRCYQIQRNCELGNPYLGKCAR